MIINNNEFNQIKAYFSFSPALELVMSLHVMTNPSHHLNSGDWVKRQYNQLSLELRKEIDYFGCHYADWAFIADVIIDITNREYPLEMSVDQTIEKLKKFPQIDFAYLFLGLSAYKYDYKILEGWIKEPKSVSKEQLGIQGNFLTVESVIYFLSNIEKIRSRIIWIISEYWEQSFRFHWENIETYVVGVIKKEKLIFERTNALEYIKDIHQDLVVDKNQIIFMKEPDFSVKTSELRKLIIHPSIFNEPHLSGNIVGDTMYILLNLNFHSSNIEQEIDNNAIGIFSALSDSSRLKIMKLLWNGDSTTKELSEVLNLSSSTISLHLKLLKEYDLVETNRIKKYVFYRLKKEPFYSIGDEIIKYFEN